MKLLGLAALALCTLAIPAHAGAALKAHLECLPDGGKLLKAKQKLAFDKPITCTVVVDSGKVPDGAKVAIDAKVTTPIGAVKGRSKDATSTDGKRYVAGPFTAGAEFLKCAGLTLDATITSGADVPWKGSLAVSAICPAAKTTTATLSCSADSDAGYVNYPGNGEQSKPPLDSGITCTIGGASDASGAHYGVLQIHGATAVAALGLLATPQGGKGPIFFNQFISPTVPKCKPFTVDAAVLDPDGAVMWTSKIAIPQVCKK